jgi:hypothetical protein
MATSVTFRFYTGVTFSRTFHYYGPSSVDIDLTGKTLTFHLSDETSEVLTLASNGGPNAHGSELAITTASEGKFSLTLTDTETALLAFTRGSWWIELDPGSERIGNGRAAVSAP